jgi:hypothetical protein
LKRHAAGREAAAAQDLVGPDQAGPVAGSGSSYGRDQALDLPVAVSKGVLVGNIQASPAATIPNGQANLVVILKAAFGVNSPVAIAVRELKVVCFIVSPDANLVPIGRIAGGEVSVVIALVGDRPISLATDFVQDVLELGTAD